MCGGIWDIRGKCGSGLVCVKPQSYPKRTNYPEGRCRSQPTRKPPDEAENTTLAEVREFLISREV